MIRTFEKIVNAQSDTEELRLSTRSAAELLEVEKEHLCIVKLLVFRREMEAINLI